MEATLEVKRHELAIMDKTGDTKTLWDPHNADEVDIARATFDKFKKKGYLIYRVGENGKKGTAMNEFDPSAEKMIASPGVVGG